MDVPSADHPPLPLTIAEPTRFAGVAAIADLYPGMSAEEKRSMIEQDLGPAFAASLERRRTILLATVGDRLVGTVQVAWENAAEEPALLPPGAAVIHHFRTHPDHRRRGIGRRLMDEVERLARRRNVAVLTLGVEPANANARRLYAKWGFREFLTYRGRQGAAMIGMRKRLAPA